MEIYEAPYHKLSGGGSTTKILAGDAAAVGKVAFLKVTVHRSKIYRKNASNPLTAFAFWEKLFAPYVKAIFDAFELTFMHRLVLSAWKNGTLRIGEKLNSKVASCRK